MTSIELRGVTVRRGGQTLLDSIDLLVPEAQSLVVVGPPSAGKSLLLRLLVGLVDPSEGDVVLDDQAVTEQSPRRRDLSMTFQDHALHPQLDVFDNLAFSSTLRRPERAEPSGGRLARLRPRRRAHDQGELADTVEDVAGLLALTDLLSEDPDAIDTAARQRVAVGRAIVRDAAGYLLDDPFAAQSPRLRPHVRSLVMQYQADRARTTLLTTSDVDEALSSSDRVAVLHQGFIHQIGTPLELYAKPADMFVAGYVGVPPMNLIAGFPETDGIRTPVGTVPVTAAVRERIGELDVVVVGVRPEHLVESDTVPDGGFSMTAPIDDVEWRGRNQYAYLGYDLDPAIEAVLDEVEELVEFDLFQSFVSAELPADRPIRDGESLSLVARPEHLHVFDPVSGENLT